MFRRALQIVYCVLVSGKVLVMFTGHWSMRHLNEDLKTVSEQQKCVLCCAVKILKILFPLASLLFIIHCWDSWQEFLKCTFALCVLCGISSIVFLGHCRHTQSTRFKFVSDHYQCSILTWSVFQNHQAFFLFFFIFHPEGCLILKKIRRLLICTEVEQPPVTAFLLLGGINLCLWSGGGEKEGVGMLNSLPDPSAALLRPEDFCGMFVHS